VIAIVSARAYNGIRHSFLWNPPMSARQALPLMGMNWLKETAAAGSRGGGRFSRPACCCRLAK